MLYELYARTLIIEFWYCDFMGCTRCMCCMGCVRSCMCCMRCMRCMRALCHQVFGLCLFGLYALQVLYRLCISSCICCMRCISCFAQTLIVKCLCCVCMGCSRCMSCMGCSCMCCMRALYRQAYVLCSSVFCSSAVEGDAIFSDRDEGIKLAVRFIRYMYESSGNSDSMYGTRYMFSSLIHRFMAPRPPAPPPPRMRGNPSNTRASACSKSACALFMRKRSRMLEPHLNTIVSSPN